MRVKSCFFYLKSKIYNVFEEFNVKTNAKKMVNNKFWGKPSWQIVLLKIIILLNLFKYGDGLLKALMQRKLFQRCTHLLYCSVLSLGGNVNTIRMAKPNIGSIYHINNQWNILVNGNYYVINQNYQNSMLLTSSDTKRTLMHLCLFTKSAQRDLVSICPQSIRNCN